MDAALRITGMGFALRIGGARSVAERSAAMER